MFNIHTGMEEATYQFHESYVCHMECNQRGNLLLTTTAWRSPMSVLWDIGAFFEMKQENVHTPRFYNNRNLSET